MTTTKKMNAMKLDPAITKVQKAGVAKMQRAGIAEPKTLPEGKALT